ncbi:protein LEG1 homolog [Nerophis ophidion]|uniref:protein LEG1 homolog n=1 Tax=Nerophis ophidion TaxID=159077 RepID=UPI002AE051D9|nr:protein LEG1 homolog [Nerophis ophidion]
MLRLPFSCLLLALAASIASSAVIVDNGMPIMWSQAAAQVTDLPVQNNIVVANPWNFLHRMSFYRMIINATNPFMNSIGPSPTDSPLWSLPLQAGWMVTSGQSYFATILVHISVLFCFKTCVLWPPQNVSLTRPAPEYVLAANFQSTLERSVLFLTPLPGRILQEGDSPPNIADMTQEENHTLHVFSWMKNMNSILGGSLISMWRGSMCSVITREKGREMLEQLLLDPSFPTSTFLSIIINMATSC